MSFARIGNWTLDMKRLVAIEMTRGNELKTGVKTIQSTAGQVMNPQSDKVHVAKLTFDGMAKELTLSADETTAFLAYMEAAYPPHAIEVVTPPASPDPS